MLFIKNTTAEVRQPPWNYGMEFAGQTLDWLPTDTEYFFEQAMKVPEHREYFQRQGWHLPGVITYKINSNGFRCDEIVESEPYLVALGCSYTCGIGLPLNTIWPELVGKELGLRVANLSWGGLSADSCFRLAEYWVPKLKPKLVAMLTPPPGRVELCLDIESTKGFRNVPVDVYMPSSNETTKDWFLKHWFLNEENHRLNVMKNNLAIKQMCDNLGIKCVVLNSMEYMNKSREEIGYARDLLHGGTIAHQRIAGKIIDDWNETKHP